MSKGKETGSSKVLNIALGVYLLIGVILVYLYTLTTGNWLNELGYFYLFPGMIFIIAALIGLSMTSHRKKHFVFVALSAVFVLYIAFILFFFTKL